MGYIDDDPAWTWYGLFHDFTIVDGIPNINVRFVWHMGDGRVEIEDVGRGVFRVKVRVESLHQGRLALSSTSESFHVRSQRRQRRRHGIELTDPAIPMTTIQMGCFFLGSAS